MGNLFGLIGEKLGHSISPQIHSKVFEILNIKGEYRLFEVNKEDVGNIVQNLRSMKAIGVNVTIPYKTEVMQYLDDISEEAQRIGAVNTISFNDGVVKGYNTDYYGFGATLEKNNIEVSKNSMLVLGTGGAAKAVIQYLIDNNVKDLMIVTRDLNVRDKRDYYDSIKFINYEGIKDLSKMGVVINCTPCGMYPNINESPLDNSDIIKFSTAIDLIYNPQETMFLKIARESGLTAINGTYMLVSQALAAEEIWNNIKISEKNVDIIYESVEKLLTK